MNLEVLAFININDSLINITTDNSDSHQKYWFINKEKTKLYLKFKFYEVWDLKKVGECWQTSKNNTSYIDVFNKLNEAIEKA